MKTSVEVIIHPVCLRFSYHNNEIVYMFASNPEQQLDEMEKLMGVGTDQGPIFDSNVGFLPVASTILIRGEKTILVDPGNYHIGFYSMLKRALNSKNLTYEDIDMIVTTHTHSDHINGIDDFRFLNVLMNKDLNMYATKKNIEEINGRFSYVFEKLSPKANGFYYKPCLNPIEIEGFFKVKDLEILSFQQDHGFGESTGFRIKNFAYSSDVFNISPDVFEKLKDLDLWIVDCLRFKPHKSHAHFDKVMEWISIIKPKKTIFTHMNYEVDYDHINSLCPKNCEAAYDGMVLKV